MGKYTKEDALKIIISCAEKYRDELAGKTLLFVCSDKHSHISCIEFSFNNSNFMHLTGVKVPEIDPETDNEANSAESFVEKTKVRAISPKDFYKRCINHKLSPSDFEFSDDETTEKKLDVLPQLICKNLSASMIGDYNSSKPKLRTDKIAGGQRACMGFVLDDKTQRYLPNTVLKEDIRGNVRDWVRVIAVYRKPKKDPQYREITYCAKKVNWEEINLPKEYAYLPLPITKVGNS